MRKALITVFSIIIILSAAAYIGRSRMIDFMLPESSRPAKINYNIQVLTEQQFEEVSDSLKFSHLLEFEHIEHFRKAGIRAYEGPKTCLGCHQNIEYKDSATGRTKSADLMENLTTSVHYRFYSSAHPNVYGFNGHPVGNLPLGEINRPFFTPGSSVMTDWATQVVLDNGDTLSEGSGQYHIGGQYAAPLGEIIPGYRTPQTASETIDCLICHSAVYDMNKKQVVRDANGRTRWDQDRSMLAAMSVTKPKSRACLRCHQQNMGGEIYIDQDFGLYHEAQANPGKERPRIAHPGSKRGTPFNPKWDVHAAAGMDCIQCHTTQGHYIARGRNTTTMMANDLPELEVSCENCHTATPHEKNEDLAGDLNSHTDKIACVTCHIPSLHDDNVTYRDFARPVYEEDPGIYIYNDTLKFSQPGAGIMYTWWNGDATFLGNPIGDNPNGKNLYRFYGPTEVWPEYVDYDYDAWYETRMRPIAQKGRPSKIYAMKRFNSRQHVDLQNIGPFGGSHLPYDLPTYYKTGDPDQAAKVGMEDSMIALMYGRLFKYYMMDKFMSFMGVDSWNTKAYEDAKNLRKVKPRWMPQDAALEISHAIRVEGALDCNSCHSPTGVLDFQALGYTKAETRKLTEDRF